MPDFVKRGVLSIIFTVAVLLLGGAFYLLTRTIEVSLLTKLLIGLILVLLFAIVAGGASVMATNKKKEGEKNKEKTEKNPESLMDEVKAILADVPENHIWVLRNVWGSDPEKKPYRGYQAKKEGLRIFIPKVWHDEVRLVSLVPLQRDPDLVEVNTKDNILPLVDYRTKTWVAQNKIGGHEEVENAAIKYALRVKDRAELEDQWIQTVLNRTTAGYFCSKPKDSNNPGDIGLTEMNESQLNKLAEKITKGFNEEMKHFGIQGEITIHNIRPPKVIEAASSQVVVSKLREEASQHEAAAMKKVIDETKIEKKDIKWVLISEAVANVARSVIGAAEQKSAEIKNREEKK